MILQGADDDGSGTATILEAYRALLKYDSRPNRTVEFYWCSAEVCPLHHRCYHEQCSRTCLGGLPLGFPSRHKRLRAHGVIPDYTDSKFTEPNKGLWEKAGYHAIFTIKNSSAKSNPHIHIANE